MAEYECSNCGLRWEEASPTPDDDGVDWSGQCPRCSTTAISEEMVDAD